MTAALFISDLHLDPARPRATAAFRDFLAGPARDAATLYILGDLFEFWIGDDDDAPLARDVTAALRRYETRPVLLVRLAWVAAIRLVAVSPSGLLSRTIAAR